MESNATVSELGVFNLPQSLRACASAHAIHHVDQNMPQINGASAFCGGFNAAIAGHRGLVAETQVPLTILRTDDPEIVQKLMSDT